MKCEVEITNVWATFNIPESVIRDFNKSHNVPENLLSSFKIACQNGFCPFEHVDGDWEFSEFSTMYAHKNQGNTWSEFDDENNIESDTLSNEIRYDLSNSWTRQEFLDEFGAWDVDNLGLKWPADSRILEMIDTDTVYDTEDTAELRIELYHQVFIPCLENKLWDSPEAEEEKINLETIISYWEYVV